MKNDLQNQPKAVVDLIKSIMEKTLEENKSSTGYQLYHKDFSSAMKHAYEFAKKKYGIDIDSKEIDDKVATGPRKPTSGKTNSYRLLDKDGKKAVQIQVYNMDNKKYELNMYKEEVELDEERWKYKGDTNYKVGGNLRYDDKLDYKLSKADADILNKYMKQAKNDAARSKVWNMFWDSKETGNKATGPVKAIAFAKKALEIVELTQAEYEHKLAAKNQSRARNNEDKKVEEDDNPCWKGYEMIGMKKKNGKEVPNCVPKKEGTTMKRFGTFMNEATGGMKMIGAADELEKYSKKSGGIDKKDFMKAVKLMRQGMSDKLVDFTNDLDTEPREKIVDVVANHIGVKATEKMFKVRFNNRSEEVEEEFVNEGKMKDLALDIDNVYKGMQKNFVMKSFADKFKQDVSKTMNIRKSLEKILPDYVSGKDIQKLMASHCVSEEKVVCPECDGKGCEHCNDKGYHMKDEELSAKQKKIDINKNGKVDGADLAKLRAKKESFEFSDLVENSDKEDAKEMSDVVKELDPKVKVAVLKKRVYDMAMEKYKNKSRANKIAGMVK